MKNSTPGHWYQVVVGNVGTVYSGHSLTNAESHFVLYMSLSDNGAGTQSYGENVTVLKNGEPIKEYVGTLKNTLMKTLANLDSAHVSAIRCNIVRQATREDWIVNLNAQEAEDKINSLLATRDIQDDKLCLSILSEIAFTYL